MHRHHLRAQTLALSTLSAACGAAALLTACGMRAAGSRGHETPSVVTAAEPSGAAMAPDRPELHGFKSLYLVPP